MNDRLIEAIRSVDPCPDHEPAPPIEPVLRRLDALPSEPPPPSRRRARVSAVAMTASSAVVVVVVLAIVVFGHDGNARTPTSSRHVAAGTLTGACRARVRDRVLPAWARAGFSRPRPRMPYALGASGRIAAIPFVTLDSPPAADHNNKILWVSRAHAPYGHPLTIVAQRMNGTKRLGKPVSRTVPGGPGPSIINLPAPGCWRFTLRWSGHTDQLDLHYDRPR